MFLRTWWMPGRARGAMTAACVVLVASGVLPGCASDRASGDVAGAVSDRATAAPASAVPVSETIEGPTASTGLDLDAVMRRVRFANREHNGGHEGGDSTYGVRVTGGRIAVTPRHFPAAASVGGRTRQARARPTAVEPSQEGSPVTLETLSAQRGAVSAIATGAPAASIGNAGELVLDRGSVRETLHNGTPGLEQSWRFSERPSGNGDLMVRVAVHGHGFRGATEQGLHFVGTKHGLGIRYGHATWVGADGAKTAVGARWTDQAIELVVPAAVVDGAD